VLDERLARSREARISFHGELLAATRLSYPLTRLLEGSGDTADGLPSYTLQAVNGPSIAEMGPLSAERASAFWRDALEALAFAHSRFNLHGGLEPACFLQGEDGRLHVLGFGLAGLAGQTPGAWRGDRAFAPPEAGSAERLDPRSDLYALGAVFYRVLTGAAPGTVPVLEFRPDLDPEVARQIMSALEADRANRPPSALACLAELEPGVDTHDTGASEVPDGVKVPRFLLEPPLIGRRELLGALLSELAAADAEATRGLALTYLAGPRGVGKSRLLEALRAEAGSGGRRVIMVDARDSGPSPFALLGSIAEVSGRKPAPDQEILLAALSGDPTGLDRRVAKVRTQAAWADLLAGLADDAGFGRRILLLIDNAEMADEASLRMLSALTQRAALPVAVVAAVTGSPPDGKRALAVPELSQADLGALAGAWLGQAAPAEPVAAALHAKTGGLPLNARTLVEVGLQAGLFPFVGGHANFPEAAAIAAFPDDPLELGRRRMAGLPYPAWQMAEGMALLGGAGRLARLGQWINMSDPAIAKAGEGLLSEGLLQIGQGGGRLANSLVEAAVMADLAPDRRRELHARLAAGLDRLDLGEESAILLAEQFSAADDGGRAATAQVRAAAYALSRGCIDQADRLISRAERLARPESGESAAVLVLRADQSRAMGRFERAYAAFEKALAVLPQITNRPDLWGNRPPPTRSGLLLEMADCRVLAGRRADAIKMAVRAIEAARTDEEALDEAVAHALKADLCLKEGRLEEAREAADLALDLTTRDFGPASRADALQVAGRICLGETGALGQAVEYLEEAREIREATGDLPGLADCEVLLADALLASGMSARAVSAYERAAARNHALGLPPPDEIALSLAVAGAAVAMGEFGPALALARAVEAQAIRAGDAVAAIQAMLLQTATAVAVGRIEEARAIVTGADEKARLLIYNARGAGNIADPHLEARVMAARAKVEIALGRPKEALTLAKGALDLVKRSGEEESPPPQEKPKPASEAPKEPGKEAGKESAKGAANGESKAAALEDASEPGTQGAPGSGEPTAEPGEEPATDGAKGPPKEASKPAPKGEPPRKAPEGVDLALATEIRLIWAEASLADDDSYMAGQQLTEIRKRLDSVNDRTTLARIAMVGARQCFERRQEDDGKAALSEALSHAKACGSAPLLAELTCLQARTGLHPQGAARGFKQALDSALELGMKALAVSAAAGLAESEDSPQAIRSLNEACEAIETQAERLPMELREAFESSHLRSSRELRGETKGTAGNRSDRLLAEFVRAFLGTTGDTTTIARILERIIAAVGGDRGMLLALDSAGQEDLRIIRPHEMAEDAGLARVAKDFITRCIKEGTALLVEDTVVDLRERPSLLKGLDLRTVACVPVRATGQVVGALYVDLHSVRRSIREQDLRLVEHLADFAGLAISQARHRVIAEAYSRLLAAFGSPVAPETREETTAT
jgi:tetratricopeptide (TPR) repeat protein